ncbi:hypothetical protein [Sphingomonas beigongshangi]|uniref:hypothetical protein n=1 Tax=Sphingomonas beigongshangi TaxID=2782540 RepID=UPI001AEEB7E3|nr:hypothetical protein [Sphingomonas beigongshangi]
MSKFNIAALAVALTGTVHVKTAAGEPAYADAERKLPLLIHLHSPGSEIASVIEGRQTARSLKRMQDNDGKITAASPEERRTETAADLAALTIGFENFDYGEGLSGEPMFRAMYEDQALGHVTRQVAKYFGDWGNFSAASTSG